MSFRIIPGSIRPFVAGAEAVFLLLVAYLLFVRVLLIFSYSLDLDGTEFSFIVFARYIQNGNLLYTDPLQYPFLATIFNPLYPYLLFFLGKAFNCISIADTHQLMVIARIISLLSMFVNLYFLYKIFQQFALPTFYYLTGTTVYLLLVTGHFYVTRPDAIRTTLFTIFVYTSIEYLFRDGRRLYLFYSVIIGLAAIYLKQDALISIYLLLGISCLYLNTKKTRVLLILFSLSLLASWGISLLLYGVHFFTNTILFNFQFTANPTSSYNLLVILFSTFRTMPLIALAFYNSYIGLKYFDIKKAEHLISLIAIFNFITFHLMMLRPGSYLNYSYESSLLMLLSAAFFFKRIEKHILRYPWSISLIFSCYLILLIVANYPIHSYSYNADKESQRRQEYFSTLKERDTISAIVKNDTVFCPFFKNTIMFTDLNLIYGYDFHLDRHISKFVAADLKKESLVSERNKLIQKMEAKLFFFSSKYYDSFFTNGRVQYIIIENTDSERKSVEKFYPHYSLVKSLNIFALYRYKQSQ